MQPTEGIKPVEGGFLVELHLRGGWRRMGVYTDIDAATRARDALHRAAKALDPRVLWLSCSSGQKARNKTVFDIMSKYGNTR